MAIIALLASITYCFFAVIAIITSLAPDFSVFYTSAQNIINKRNIYTDTSLYTGLGYPPVSVIWFIPFALLPYQTAQAFWIIGIVVCMLLSCWISLKLVQPKHSKHSKHIYENFCFVVLLVCASFPFQFTLGMGQVNTYVFLLFLISLVFITKRKPTIAGILLGLVCMLKPQFLFFLPIVVLCRHLKTVYISISTMMIFVCFHGIYCGWDQYLMYITTYAPRLLDFSSAEPYYNQGIAAFFSRTLPLFYVKPCWILCLGFFVAVLWYKILTSKLSLVQAVALSFPVFLLIEPLSWQHHYVFLLLSFVYGWFHIKTFVGKTLLFISYILVSWNIENPQVFFASGMGSILLTHVGLGTLLLEGILLASHLRKSVI